MSTMIRFVPAAVLAVLCLVGTTPTALAQDQKAGPFYLKNTSKKAVKFTDLTYTDGNGVERKLADTYWDIKAGAAGALTYKGEKVVATKVTVKLVTDAGTTLLTWTSQGLDADGDMYCELTDKDITEHLKLLGKAPAAPPVVALKPSDDELATQSEAARQTVKNLEDQIRITNNRILVAQLALVAAKKAYDDAPAGSAKEVLAELAYIAAQRAHEELKATRDSQQADLRAARSLYERLRN